MRNLPSCGCELGVDCDSGAPVAEIKTVGDYGKIIYNTIIFGVVIYNTTMGIWVKIAPGVLLVTSPGING